MKSIVKQRANPMMNKYVMIVCFDENTDRKVIDILVFQFFKLFPFRYENTLIIKQKTMKKIFLLATLLIGTLTSFAQVKPKTKDIDKESSVVIDSLSKVYKVKVQSYMVETYNGIKQTSISYVEDKKLVYIVIKTESIK